MKFKTKKSKILLVILISIPLLLAFFTWQNNSITVSEILFENDNVPEAFDGYKILQISDLHNKEFGNNQSRLLEKIKNINPNIIVITGDLIDSNNTDIHIAMDLIDGAVKIAPIYYVSGNHEAWSNSYDELKKKLENSGVKVLDNTKLKVSHKGDSIDIIGLSDPSFSQLDLSKYLNNIKNENSKSFKILLSHRPELFHEYSDTNVDLVFSGHAHGGQFRLPFIGGLVAPDQGIFPELTEGIHKDNNTSMVISRGLGNSIIPLRIFNRPELVVVNLSK